MKKREALRLYEEQERLDEERGELEKERERLEAETRSREALELEDYFIDYEVIKEEFIEKVARLSEELEGEILNTNELRELSLNRMDAAIGYRDKFTALDVPVPLETFYEYELEFIESDIKTIGEVLLYYESDSYSTYDDGALNELYIKTDLLYGKAEEELLSVYSQYELGYLLE